jgi:hypothetical protein
MAISTKDTTQSALPPDFAFLRLLLRLTIALFRAMDQRNVQHLGHRAWDEIGLRQGADAISIKPL